MQDSLPSYDDLLESFTPPGSSWGLWGQRDVFGCLNLLTPERVLRGVSLVKRGAVFPLNLDLELPDPPLFGRDAFSHTVLTLTPDGHAHDDEINKWNTQSSSQWDGFRHVGHPGHGFYGATPDEEHGVHHWARKGIVGRAVLADVARWREAAGRPLTMNESDPFEASEVRSTLESQSVDVQPGDILLIRTGWMGWYKNADQETRAGLEGAGLKTPGLKAGEDSARLLWDLHVAAVAADNPMLENWPPPALSDPAVLAKIGEDPGVLAQHLLHYSLLPLLGIPIGELWDFEALADDCAADGVYEFLLTSAPLNLKGGAGSPPNALAIK